MNMKKLFMNLIIVLFAGVVALSVVTVVKRKNEPEEVYVAPNHTQSVVVGNELLNTEDVESELEVLESTEMAESTEGIGTTETTESSESSESEAEQEQTTVEMRSLYAAGSVNIRSGPGISYNRIGSLGLNAEVTAVGLPENGWQKIQYRDKEGYVSMEYLSETPVEIAPTTSQTQESQQSDETTDADMTNDTDETTDADTTNATDETADADTTNDTDETTDADTTNAADETADADTTNAADETTDTDAIIDAEAVSE